jgi:hypothetical protein
VSIAVQIGQEVYDQLRAEHAITMAELQKDMGKHFADIRQVVVINMLDLQRRSVSYRIRFDFDYDVQRLKHGSPAVGNWCAPGSSCGCPAGTKKQERRAADAPGDYEDFFGDEEPQGVGAPTELPSDPGIARVLTLASDETPD